MSTIRSDGMNPKGELLDHVIDEIDRALLVMPLVDFECTNPGRIVDCRELIATDLAVILRSQIEKLHVYLDVMARDLLGVAASVDGATSDIARQGTYPIALERAIDARTGGLEAMVTLEIPGNSLGTEVVLGSQVKDLLDELPGNLTWMASRNGFLANQSGSSLSRESVLPAVEG